MDEGAFKARTKGIGVRVVRLVDSLPNKPGARTIGRQLVRSGTAIGANYRAACRAISHRDMLSKLGDVEEEADETLYWLEMLGDAGIVKLSLLAPLMGEVEQILAMIVSSIKTLRANPKSKIQNLK